MKPFSILRNAIGSRSHLERVHSIPRRWSNNQLAKFAHLFKGDVINVSAWQDQDKEGRRYRDYFSRCSSYTISNFDHDKRGMQGLESEFYLDLSRDLDSALIDRFDVVFNHTTLEHIYDFQTAFKNLCRMSRDCVIIVVPFLQPMHSEYGDYWRFTPTAIERLFNDSEMEVAYMDFNRHHRSSVYIFSIATKRPYSWTGELPFAWTHVDQSAGHTHEPYPGCWAFM